MTKDTKLLHSWSNHANKVASIRARLLALANKMGSEAAEKDYSLFLNTGNQPFSQQDETT